MKSELLFYVAQMPSALIEVLLLENTSIHEHLKRFWIYLCTESSKSWINWKISKHCFFHTSFPRRRNKSSRLACLKRAYAHCYLVIAKHTLSWISTAFVKYFCSYLLPNVAPWRVIHTYHAVPMPCPCRSPVMPCRANSHMPCSAPCHAPRVPRPS